MAGGVGSVDYVRRVVNEMPVRLLHAPQCRLRLGAFFFGPVDGFFFGKDDGLPPLRIEFPLLHIVSHAVPFPGYFRKYFTPGDLLIGAPTAPAWFLLYHEGLQKGVNYFHRQRGDNSIDIPPALMVIPSGMTIS